MKSVLVPLFAVLLLTLACGEAGSPEGTVDRFLQALKDMDKEAALMTLDSSSRDLYLKLTDQFYDFWSRFESGGVVLLSWTDPKVTWKEEVNRGDIVEAAQVETVFTMGGPGGEREERWLGVQVVRTENGWFIRELDEEPVRSASLHGEVGSPEGTVDRFLQALKDMDKEAALMTLDSSTRDLYLKLTDQFYDFWSRFESGGVVLLSWTDPKVTGGGGGEDGVEFTRVETVFTMGGPGGEREERWLGVQVVRTENGWFIHELDEEPVRSASLHGEVGSPEGTVDRFLTACRDMDKEAALMTIYSGSEEYDAQDQFYDFWYTFESGSTVLLSWTDPKVTKKEEMNEEGVDIVEVAWVETLTTMGGLGGEREVWLRVHVMRTEQGWFIIEFV